MSVIIGLKEKNRYKENLGDFALFVLNYYSNNTEILRVFENFDEKDLDELDERYKKFIRSNMRVKQPDIDTMYEIFDNLFTDLYYFYHPAKEQVKQYSKIDGVNQIHPYFNIFTTNYDTSIEKYFKVKKNDVYTGASGPDKILDLDGFAKKIPEKDRLQTYLIKIHGSINWIKNNKGNLIEEDIDKNFDFIKETNADGDIIEEVMIYPLSQKQLYLFPFIQLFNFLERELKSNKIWIVIGYSFRDIIIRNMFEKSVDTITKILLVAPDSSDVKKLFSSNIQSKIIDINCRFGKEYRNTNQCIVDELKRISGSF